MKLCEGRNKAADLSTMPKVNTAEEALLCTAAVDAPLKQLPQGTTQDDISPLPKRTQYEYKAQMAQAIGHVRRPGQEKLVQVYRIVALDTIDVDILEHREHRTTVMAEYKHSDVEKKRSPGTDFEDKLKPELIKPQKTELIRDVNGEYKLVPRQMLLAAGGEGRGSRCRLCQGRADQDSRAGGCSPQAVYPKEDLLDRSWCSHREAERRQGCNDRQRGVLAQSEGRADQ